MLGLPEPTADEIAAQVALAAPPAPPVLSDAAKAASDKVIDKAKKEERQSKSERLEGDWLTPVPDAIKAKHTSEDAEKAAAKAQKTPKDKADKKAFALFTGGPATMNADGSVGPKKYQNLPVWVVVYDNVPWTVGGLSASTGGQVLNSTVYYVINDETGEAILALTAANP